jgi:DNA-binding MarR family transcriptional regulator
MVMVTIIVLVTPATTPTTPAAPTADEIVDAVAPLLAQQRQKWAERCQAHGLSIVGFHVLALLEVHGPMPMSHMADELGVALPNATGIIGRLAERGIVTREHDPADRRVVLVALSNEGRALIDEMDSARRDRLRRLLSVMKPEQRSRLLRTVGDLKQAASRLAGNP